VLVGGHARLVGSLEDGVPAGAGAEVPVHVAGVVLPEVPQDDDVGRRDEGRGQGTAGGGQPGDVKHFRNTVSANWLMICPFLAS